MKKMLYMILSGIIILSSCRKNASSNDPKINELLKDFANKRVKLPNGWSLTPAGRSINLANDLPLNMVVSPSKKYIALTNNGQATQSVTLIDAQTDQILDDKVIAKSWVGLAFSPDEKYVYVSGGNDNKIMIYRLENGKLIDDSEIVLGKPLPNKISPTGLCVTEQNLYVVTKENNSLYVCDLADKSVVRKVKLPAEAYTCLLSSDKKTLYISLWGGAKILYYNTDSQVLTAEVAVDKNPNDLVLTKDGKYLFVAHGNDNTVSVIETATHIKIETLSASLYPDSPIGTTPNGLALNTDETKLFIANADNNCLAVFDIADKGKSKSLGFIPTGWYPTAVKLIGDKIFVANGKGFSSLPNPKGPNPVSSKTSQVKGGNPEANRGSQYIGGLFKGTVSVIDMPDERTLAAYSSLVYENSPYNKDVERQAEGEKGNPIPTKLGETSPIKYVFYIIKENRTYDQVLGDVKTGNGDASLCLFPEKITPNQHALVKNFVLLDNFYVDAEVSADGHNWSTAAYANDFVEKTWVTSYGGRGGSYDFEGSRKIAHPKNGFIWDFCKRANVSYRTYGEFTSLGKASIEAIDGHYCKNFRDYNLSYKDVDREKVWEKDLDSLIAINAVPKFNSVRMGNDHTSGARLGMPTPEAAVADNDLAVGKFVEHLSKSKIWNESVVFILEDDAQNGPDHVDAHRSPCYVAGGFVKRGFVDHTAYSTSSVLRTMELILGLPPMSQYDAAAKPLWRCFSQKADSQGFTALQAGVNLDERNVAININSKKSSMWDLSKEDAAPDIAFNEVIWQTVRGLHSKMPAPRRSAFVVIAKKSDDEDEDDDD